MSYLSIDQKQKLKSILETKINKETDIYERSRLMKILDIITREIFIEILRDDVIDILKFNNLNIKDEDIDEIVFKLELRYSIGEDHEKYMLDLISEFNTK